MWNHFCFLLTNVKNLILSFFVRFIFLLSSIFVRYLVDKISQLYLPLGKSQKIGVGLLVTGILAIVITYILTFEAGTGVTTQFDDGVFIDALVSGISALAGMIIGMFVILFVLMKVDTVDDLEDLDLEDLEDLDLDEELKKLEKELNAESTDSSGEEE